MSRGDVRVGEQPLDLRGEQQAAADRPCSRAASCPSDRAPAAADRGRASQMPTREHAVEWHRGSPRPSSSYWWTIASVSVRERNVWPLASRPGSQVGVVVDLAVEGDPDRAVLVGHRLVPRRRRDRRSTAGGGPSTTRRSGDSQRPASSGPRWVMASRMALHRVALVARARPEVVQPGYPAHGAPIPVQIQDLADRHQLATRRRAGASTVRGRASSVQRCPSCRSMISPGAIASGARRAATSSGEAVRQSSESRDQSTVV